MSVNNNINNNYVNHNVSQKLDDNTRAQAPS